MANRAVLSLKDTEAAIKVLESPDPNSADKEFDGRRIERVPGGWMVLNAKKHHDLTNREIAKEKVRQRVARHRLRKQIGLETEKSSNAAVTPASTNSLKERNA